MVENNEELSELRTLHDSGELLRIDNNRDEAWIRLKGFEITKDHPVPDDVPLEKTTYLGPFYIYEYE